MSFRSLRHGVCRVRSGAIVIAVSSMLAVCAAGLLAPAAGFGSASVTSCTSTQLTFKFVSFKRASGHGYWQFAFKNLGSKCSIKGFPAVYALNASGGMIFPQPTIKNQGSAATVILAKGKSAYFTLSYTQAGTCTKKLAIDALRIIPPDAVAGPVFNLVPADHGPISACIGSLHVSPYGSKQAAETKS
jgi:hypothetical protein